MNIEKNKKESSMKQADENLKSALKVLETYTAGTFDVWRLAGPAKAGCRQHVMSELTGQKTPKAKAGVNAIKDELCRRLAVVGGCAAAKDDDLVVKARAILSGAVDDVCLCGAPKRASDARCSDCESPSPKRSKAKTAAKATPKLDALKSMREAKASKAEAEKPAAELPPPPPKHSDGSRPREIIDDQAGIMFGVKNKATREYVHVLASDSDSARRATGWDLAEISYTMQLESSEKKPMSEETKNKLKAIKAERKSLRKAVHAGVATEEQKHEAKKILTKAAKSAAAKMGAKKRVLKILVFGKYPVTKVLLTMGKWGWTDQQALKALKGVKVSPLPSANTVSKHIKGGAVNAKWAAAPAELTREECRQLKKI